MRAVRWVGPNGGACKVIFLLDEVARAPPALRLARAYDCAEVEEKNHSLAVDCLNATYATWRLVSAVHAAELCKYNFVDLHKYQPVCDFSLVQAAGEVIWQNARR